MESINKIPCIICGSITRLLEHPRTHVKFHECPYCQVIFKNIIHHPTPDVELKTYNDHHNSINDAGYVNFLNNFIDSAVLPYKKEGTVLDFGSGPTPVLATLIKQSGTFEVDIYDPFYADDFVFHQQQYDVITTTEVIEHLKDPMTTFKHLQKHLKQDGILAIMTLFHPRDEKQFMDWFYIRDVTHLVFYTPRTMEVIGNRLGMKVIDTNDYRYVVMKKVSF